MKRKYHLLLPALVLCLFLQNACFAALADGEFGIFGGKLYKKGAKYTIEAIQVPGLGSCGGELDKMIPAMAHVAEVGGNTVCLDLEGFNTDGTELSEVGIESVKKVAERAKDQRMGTVVRVLGDSTDPIFRKNATLTAANTFKLELRAIYWFDGPDADKLASEFKAIATKAVVAAPKNGDLTIVTELPEKQPDALTVVYGHIPTAYANWDTHYILAGDESNYTALDNAKMTDTEKNPPVFDATTLSAEEQKAGFTPIFNGKNLDGWWYFGNNHKTFKVNEAGEIEFVVTGGAAIQTAKRYENFILRLEWRINDGGNSGIFLRAPRAARQSKIGMEFQLHGDHGQAPNDDATGAIYKVVPALANASKPAKEWNELEVIANGPHIKATMNGVVIQDLNFDEIPEMKHRLRKGFIGLQDHANWVSFRNIRIKELE